MALYTVARSVNGAKWIFRNIKEKTDNLKEQLMSGLDRKERGHLQAIEALQSARSLSYPMALLPYSALKKCKMLLAHEELRARLVFIDEYADLTKLVEGCPFTVFISHQWLGSSYPDPNKTHFKSICAALDVLCSHLHIHENELLVWIDFSCIPQKNKVQQALAISSIGVYASCCRYFITIAPDAEHEDLQVPCNIETYTSRGWCRLENLARLCVGGTDGMFIYSRDNELKSVVDDDTLPLNEIICVFDGNFSDPADKKKLVPVILGQWSLLLQDHMEKYTHENQAKADVVSKVEAFIRDNRERVFPKAFFNDSPEILEDMIRAVQKARQGESVSDAKEFEVVKMLLDSSRSLLEAEHMWSRPALSRDNHNVSPDTRRKLNDKDHRTLRIGDHIMHVIDGEGIITAAQPGVRTVRFTDGSECSYEVQNWTMLHRLSPRPPSRRHSRGWLPKQNLALPRVRGVSETRISISRRSSEPLPSVPDRTSKSPHTPGASTRTES